MKKLACVTIDMEPDHGDPEKRIRLLEDPKLFERFVSLIHRYNAKVTMFTVTSLFASHGKSFQALAEQIPLEFASHSHSHDPYNACSQEEVKNSQLVLTDFTGEMPLGYRAPIGRIDREGLIHLLDHGFAYDASIYPSVRPGKFGYFNLHMPNMPFKITRQDGASLIEFPFTSINKVRIVYALSYAKLLGWKAFSVLLKLFGLPEIALLLVHPHDFYFGDIPNNNVTGTEYAALSRNTGNEFEIFEKLLEHLQKQGYEFAFISEIYDQIHTSDLRTFTLETWK